MLERLLAADLIGFVLVFCRMGSAMMLLPGFGEAFVSPRIRLLLALAVTLVAAPVVATALPRFPAGVLPGAGVIITEMGVGLFLGAAARLMLSALQVAGSVIAVQTNMANAFTNDPVGAEQGAVTTGFLTTLGLVLVFATDLHHLMLTGLVESYAIFQPGNLPPLGDFSEAITRVIADSFRIGLQLAAPFVVIGILTNAGMGLLARLMPQIQIFFVAMPVQIALGFLVLTVTLSAGMGAFLDGYEDGLGRLFMGR